MFFYKQRENSQKMHVFVQRPQKISKKAGSPIRTYPSWSNRLRTGADQTALRAQEPAGSLRQKNEKNTEYRKPILCMCFHYTIDEHITASDFCNLLIFFFCSFQNFIFRGLRPLYNFVLVFALTLLLASFTCIAISGQSYFK